VQRNGEKKTDTYFVKTLLHGSRFNAYRHPERLKHIGAAAFAGHGTVPVLCNRRARSRGNECRGGGYVEGMGPVAARAAGVDDMVVVSGKNARRFFSMVSPFIRKATMNAAIWASVAFPVMISLKTSIDSDTDKWIPAVMRRMASCMVIVNPPSSNKQYIFFRGIFFKNFE
jgi:hypothetical protein